MAASALTSKKLVSFLKINFLGNFYTFSRENADFMGEYKLINSLKLN